MIEAFIAMFPDWQRSNPPVGPTHQLSNACGHCPAFSQAVIVAPKVVTLGYLGMGCQGQVDLFTVLKRVHIADLSFQKAQERSVRPKTFESVLHLQALKRPIYRHCNFRLYSA